MIGIANELTLPSGLIVGGQPDAAAIERAKAQGVTTIINLRPSSEAGQAEAQAAITAHGLRLVTIPVDGAAGLTEDNARALDGALLEAGEGSTVLHCASGNRVGALLALRAFHAGGLATSDALQVGRASGLKGLASAVVEYLNHADQ